jgi:hypothetical protein
MRMVLSMFWVLTALAAAPLAVGAEEPPAAPPLGADGIPPLLRAPRADRGSIGVGAAGAGLRAYLDPVTGRLVAHPSQAQVRALTRALAEHRLEQGVEYGTGWDTEGLYRFVLRDGGSGVALDGRFLTSTVVHVGPDGELQYECSHDPDEALADASASPETPSGTPTGAPLK